MSGIISESDMSFAEAIELIEKLCGKAVVNTARIRATQRIRVRLEDGEWKLGMMAALSRFGVVLEETHDQVVLR